jgi:hypothetical protein
MKKGAVEKHRYIANIESFAEKAPTTICRHKKAEPSMTPPIVISECTLLLEAGYRS